MGRRRPSPRQTALAEVDQRPREVPRPLVVDMRTRELGSLAGFFDGKNVYIDLCDLCHEPGIFIRRWYHTQPCVNPCTRMSAPRPAVAALQRLLKWWHWCQAEARKKSHVEVERAKELERLIWPMQHHLLYQIARADRRNLPTISECRMIKQAMERTADEHFIDPLEIEEWSARSTSSAD